MVRRPPKCCPTLVCRRIAHRCRINSTNNNNSHPISKPAIHMVWMQVPSRRYRPASVPWQRVHLMWVDCFAILLVEIKKLELYPHSIFSSWCRNEFAWAITYAFSPPVLIARLKCDRTSRRRKTNLVESHIPYHIVFESTENKVEIYVFVVLQHMELWHFGKIYRAHGSCDEKDPLVIVTCLSIKADKKIYNRGSNEFSQFEMS